MGAKRTTRKFWRILSAFSGGCFVGCGLCLRWGAIHNWPTPDQAPMHFFVSAFLAGLGVVISIIAILSQINKDEEK
jgi:formate/nitrite transporter FocA (FNT family)